MNLIIKESNKDKINALISEALLMCKDLNNIVLEFLQNESSVKYKGSKVILKRR